MIVVLLVVSQSYHYPSASSSSSSSATSTTDPSSSSSASSTTDSSSASSSRRRKSPAKEIVELEVQFEQPDYQDFELPTEDEYKLVAKILEYCGISIRETQVTQFGMVQEQQQQPTFKMQ